MAAHLWAGAPPPMRYIEWRAIRMYGTPQALDYVSFRKFIEHIAVETEYERVQAIRQKQAAERAMRQSPAKRKR